MSILLTMVATLFLLIKNILTPFNLSYSGFNLRKLEHIKHTAHAMAIAIAAFL